jgi:elongation factor G
MMGGNQQIIAHIPMAELLTYDQDLRSITGGRGGFSMHFHAYEEVPAHIAVKVIEASRRAVGVKG